MIILKIYNVIRSNLVENEEDTLGTLVYCLAEKRDREKRNQETTK